MANGSHNGTLLWQRSTLILLFGFITFGLPRRVLLQKGLVRLAHSTATNFDWCQ